MENKTIRFKGTTIEFEVNCEWMDRYKIYGVDMSDIGSYSFGPKTIARMLVALNELNLIHEGKWNK